MRSISNEINTFNNIDCIEYMKTLPNNSVDMTLTDIPYGEVSRETNGLTNLKSLDNLGAADRKTFDEIKFCEEVYRITKNSICIFCGREQFSTIFQFFKDKKGTVRPIVWEKTNPVPSNGKYVYLSGVEFAVWFKKLVVKVLMLIVKILYFDTLFHLVKKEFIRHKNTGIYGKKLC